MFSSDHSFASDYSTVMMFSRLRPRYVEYRSPNVTRKYPTHLPVTDLSYNLAEAYIIATTIGQVLATIVLGARIYTRTFPKWRFSADDYFICLGYLVLCAMWGMMISAETYVIDSSRPKLRSLSSIEHSAKLGVISTPVWAWSIGFVKISIACMLLRFQQSRKWRIFIYCMIGVNVTGIAFTGFANIFQCIPYAVNWDILGKIKDKRCWDTRSQHVCLYTGSGLHILTDIVYSLLPLTFLRKIRRPARERAVIAGLMALGLFASSLSLAKAIWGGRTDSWRDKTSVNIMFGLLSALEVQTAIIAACVPTLRGAARAVLQKLGVISTEEEEQERMSQYGEGSSISGGPRRRTRFIQLGRLHISTLKTNKQATQHRSRNLSDNEGRSEGKHPNQPLDVREVHGQEDEEMSEKHYEMDPRTGRIICRTFSKTRSSQTNLRDEWIQEDGQPVHTQEEWERRSGSDRHLDDGGGSFTERKETWSEQR